MRETIAAVGMALALSAGRPDTGPSYPGRLLEVGIDPRTVAVGDVDGDCRADLVVANRGSGDLTVLRGRANGGYREGESIPVGGAPVFSGSGTAGGGISVGDLDGDRIPDAVVENHLFAPIGLEVLLGNGDGTFHLKGTIPLDESPTASVIGDLDGDHRADLVVATGSPAPEPRLRFFSGNGDGSFAAARALEMPPMSAPHDLALAEVDGRDTDLVVASGPPGGTSGLFVIHSRGRRGFDAARRFAAPASEDLTVADFNGDRRPDIAIADWETADVAVLLHDGPPPGNRPLPLLLLPAPPPPVVYGQSAPEARISRSRPSTCAGPAES